MYQNRNSSTSQTRRPQFFIRRYQSAFGPEAAFVESVCANLIESRFGPGRLIPVIVVLTDRPKLEPAALYDFDDNDPSGLVPFYALPSLGRKGYQTSEASYRIAKQIMHLDARPNGNDSASALTPNQGRGSP